MFHQYHFDDPDLTKAFNNLETARNRFNNASTPDKIDEAIYELAAAEFYLRAVLQRIRSNA